jgi:AAA-like domain
MRPPARAIVGHLVWSTDGGVWAVWRVSPFAHAHNALADKLAVHARLRALLLALPPASMLLAVTEELDPWETVADMAEGVDLDWRPAWAEVCSATADWLGTVALRRRRYYLAVELPDQTRGWVTALRAAATEVTGAFGMAPAPIPAAELDRCERQARELEVRIGSQVTVHRVTPGELCWLYARSLRREIDEPPFDEHWEPGGRGGAGPSTRPRGVLAHLTDAVVREGGDKDDEDRPRHRRYTRIDGPDGSAYQTVLAVADMPHFFTYPGGGGEWLYYVDQLGFPVDWCVRLRSVRNADAQVKVRRKHRDLVGQIGEYDGDTTGAPPQLAEAIRAIDDERTQLGANPAEPELQATILLSVAAPTLPELEERAAALSAQFEPDEYGLARPTGGQAALLRSMLPGTAAAPVARDYTQFLLARDLAAGAPFCGPDVGDPTGLMLGVSLDTGGMTPVLFDPAFGPRANASPSLAAVGRLGSGKSFMLKRLCWDTVSRGGQVVTIDRTRSGEYVTFAESIAGDSQIVRIEAGADVCLDPLRSFSGDERSSVTLGFLSLLAGCSAHSEEGAALAEAVDTVVERPGACLGDVVDELERMGTDTGTTDQAARGLARRLTHYRRSSTGQLAFGSSRPVSLDADFIVFWAPNLALPDRETLASEQRARMMLPEQVLGQALLYLVAAVGRRVVFRDPRRFAAALYDEAWALLASPYGQSLLIEGIRDGRKHNGAIWLASQHPNDFAVSELADLLGSRFVFRQARQAIPAALRFLGVDDSADAAGVLQQELGSGQCLYRDVRDRVGLVQIVPPILDSVAAVFETAPGSQPVTGVSELAAGSPIAPDHAVAEPRAVEPPAADPPAAEPAEPVVEPPAEPVVEPPSEPVEPAVEPVVLEPVDVDPVEVATIDAPGPDPAAAVQHARSAARRRRRSPLARALAPEDG